ncbi:MAG: hypothetical protein OK454_07135, partial [Thaumarchaeota archaeon]|nr:hypothetical protein [Nitrososphaerota archaeon]
RCFEPMRRLKEQKSDISADNRSSSTLSRGLGAPRPLTAGPPGQRQHKHADLPSSVRTLQENARGYGTTTGGVATQPVTSSRLSIADARAGAREPRQPQPISPFRKPSLLQRQDEREHISGSLSHHPTPLDGDGFLPPISANRNSILETLPPEAIQRYYPAGLPADYNFESITPLSPGWLDNYPLEQPGRPWLSTKELTRREAKVNAAFYEGTEGLNKSIDDIIAEAERRHFAKSVGIIGEERERMARVRRTTQLNATLNMRDSHQGHGSRNPRMSIEEANRQTRSEHAEPLLNMAFAALLGYVEEGGKKGRMGGFEVPEPHLIDNSEKGRKGFFDTDAVTRRRH